MKLRIRIKTYLIDNKCDYGVCSKNKKRLLSKESKRF